MNKTVQTVLVVGTLVTVGYIIYMEYRSKQVQTAAPAAAHTPPANAASTSPLDTLEAGLGSAAIGFATNLFS